MFQHDNALCSKHQGEYNHFVLLFFLPHKQKQTKFPLFVPQWHHHTFWHSKKIFFPAKYWNNPKNVLNHKGALKARLSSALTPNLLMLPQPDMFHGFVCFFDMVAALHVVNPAYPPTCDAHTRQHGSAAMGDVDPIFDSL